MARSELLFDCPLTFEQPVHRRVQIVLVGIGDLELFGQGGGVPPAGGGELGMRGDDARGHHRAYQIALAAPTRGHEPLEAESLHGYTHGFDVAMRSRGNRLEEFVDGVKLLSAQDRADGEDLLVGQRGEVGEGALSDFAAFAE